MQPLRSITIRNDDGTELKVYVTEEIARVIRDLGIAAKKREARHKKREKTFSEIGVDARIFEAPPRFRWLIGESRIWNGEPQIAIDGQRVCSFCWGSELPRYAYCLGCDACGRELAIPGLTDDERTECRRAGAADGLKGGLGK